MHIHTFARHIHNPFSNDTILLYFPISSRKVGASGIAFTGGVPNLQKYPAASFTTRERTAQGRSVRNCSFLGLFYFIGQTFALPSRSSSSRTRLPLVSLRNFPSPFSRAHPPSSIHFYWLGQQWLVPPMQQPKSCPRAPSLCTERDTRFSITRFSMFTVCVCKATPHPDTSICIHVANISILRIHGIGSNEGS